MRAIVVSSAAAVLLLPAVSLAAQSCPDRTPAAITGVAPAALKCQKTIANVAGKYVKAKLKAHSKCRLKEPAGSCPTAAATLAAEKAAVKAAEKIAKDCAADTAQAGLTSSYGALTDHEPIASCMLSQHNVATEILIGVTHGVTTEPFPGEPAGRAKCIQEIAKSGVGYALGALKTITKCVDKAMKDGIGGNLADRCVGRYSGGSFVPPADVKIADKLAKLVTKIEDKLAKSCAGGGGPFGFIQMIFACPEAESVADLQKCVICDGWTAVLDLVEEQYAERGTFVPHGAGAIQAAVDAATSGDKLLIASGTYEEDVVVGTNDLALVGCGGATGDRPRIVPPPVMPDEDGIFAANTDDLLFQSLEFFDWDENGIFVTGANNVAFRDIVADGNLNSTYGVFPVNSQNVLIEACTALNVADAALYVGQSEDIVVRYNRVESSVAGIEIENSARATVHNNYAAGNTGGILVFKLPGLPVQLSNDHAVFNNLSENNNTPNFGVGFVGNIPDGTGMLVISTDDSRFHHNIMRGNNSIGFGLLDQQVINALVSPPPFAMFSPDQNCRRNLVRQNSLINNGGSPNPNLPFGSHMIFALGDDGGGNHDNCFQLNIPTGGAFLTASDCIP
jgi:parallel beta-helix repeat protein